MTASATIAAIGATEFFVFFVPERDAAVPTVTGDDVNKGFVNKFHGAILKTKAPTGGAFVQA